MVLSSNLQQSVNDTDRYDTKLRYMNHKTFILPKTEYDYDLRIYTSIERRRKIRS